MKLLSGPLAFIGILLTKMFTIIADAMTSKIHIKLPDNALVLIT